ncbi:uncharacterized protein LOC129611625 [Condylostylus longicornis]|uniref:uncharacterized protein LOC129611625 n=1 Tax=Condylostylus longicornis TaxID=2530218 RepID=UPI00244E5616|nr:uncharacterized protein LOC129611625 [Condylostylus longicornis]
MDEIIKKVKCAGRGYKIGDNEIKCVCFADDAVLISDSEDNLQRLVYAFEKAAEEFNMEISVEKTKNMVISKNPLRCKLAVYEKSIEQVMEFKYLGALITSSRDLTKEVKTQATKASSISGYLKDVIWKNKHMNIRSKTRIYKTCIRPIITYAIESRADTKKTENIMSAAEMATLRSITGYTRYDHKRNDEVREIWEIQDIVKWSRRRRKEWNQHVQRMSPDRVVKRAFMGKPSSCRLPGRPPKRWQECWTSGSMSDHH